MTLGPAVSTVRVAVIVVHWNKPDETIACVESLLKSRGVDLEVTIVDNASEPSAVATLEARLPKVRLLRSYQNLGYAGAFNLGFRHVTVNPANEYIWLLNNDTVVDPWCAQHLVSAAEQLGCGVFSPKILAMDDPTRLWYAGGVLESNLKSHHLGRGETDDGRFDATRQIPWASGCSLFAHREVCAEVGPMDEDYFLYLEDVDWCLRAGRAGVPTYFVADARVFHGISRSVAMLDERSLVYYGWRNYYFLAFRNGDLLQRLGAVCDLASRLIKSVIKLLVDPGTRSDRAYLARFRALIDVLRNRVGPAPYQHRVTGEQSGP